MIVGLIRQQLVERVRRRSKEWRGSRLGSARRIRDLSRAGTEKRKPPGATSLSLRPRTAVSLAHIANAHTNLMAVR